jgi:hypothetical protein
MGDRFQTFFVAQNKSIVGGVLLAENHGYVVL